MKLCCIYGLYILNVNFCKILIVFYVLNFCIYNYLCIISICIKCFDGYNFKLFKLCV